MKDAWPVEWADCYAHWKFNENTTLSRSGGNLLVVPVFELEDRDRVPYVTTSDSYPPQHFRRCCSSTASCNLFAPFISG